MPSPSQPLPSRRPGLWALAALLALLWAGGLGAAPPPAAEIAGAIAQLGASRFKDREAASQKLLEFGEAAIPQLEKAAASDDPEVAGRAERTLFMVRLGITPQTPPETAALLRRYAETEGEARAAALEALLAGGQTSAQALLSLAHAERDEARRTRLRQAAAQSFDGKRLRQLLADGQAAEVAAALELRAREYYAPQDEKVRDWVAWLVVSGSAAAWRERSRPQPPDPGFAVYLALVQGRLDEVAVPAAEAAGTNRSLAVDLATWRRDWAALAAEQARVLKPGNPEQLGSLATYRRLAGQEAEFLAAEKQLVELATDERQAAIAIKVLLLNERPESALAIARNRQPGVAAELLSGAARYPELREFLAGRQDLFDLHLDYAPLWYELGLQEEALAMLNSARDRWQEGNRAAGLALLAAQARLDLTEQAHATAAKLWAEAPLAGTEHPDAAILRALFGRDWSIAQLWLPILQTTPPDESVEARLGALEILLGRRVQPARLEALQPRLLAGLASLDDEAQAGFLMLLSAACNSHGRKAQADDFRARALKLTQNPGLLLDEAQRLAAAGQWDAVPEPCARALKLEPLLAPALYLRGLALQHGGQAAAGAALVQCARLLPLGDGRQRLALATCLEAAGLADAAAAEYELCMRLLRPGTTEHLDAAQALAALREKQQRYGDAADLLRVYSLGFLARNRHLASSRGYLLLGARRHQLLARQALANGQPEAAGREAQLALDLEPGDVDPLIDLIASLDQGPRRDLADALYRRVADPLAATIAAWPQGAAEARNNAAWLAAKCNRELPLAHAWASRAVALRPRTAAYLDTLAEVEFRQGHAEAAAKLMRRCLELEPWHDYFHDQLRRFTAAQP